MFKLFSFLKINMIDRADLDILRLVKKRGDYTSPQTASRILGRPFGGTYRRFEKICRDGFLIRNGGVVEYYLTDRGIDLLKKS